MNMFSHGRHKQTSLEPSRIISYVNATCTIYFIELNWKYITRQSIVYDETIYILMDNLQNRTLYVWKPKRGEWTGYTGITE